MTTAARHGGRLAWERVAAVSGPVLLVDPFRELDQVTQQLARQTRPAVPMGAYRHDDHFVVEFDLPGVDPSSIDLTVEKNVLSVSATRTRSFVEGDDEGPSVVHVGPLHGRPHLNWPERFSGSFCRLGFPGPAR
jgi:HSP20 family molecular chaperone IbpA